MFILWRSWQSGARPIYESSCWQHKEVDWGIWTMFASILGCNVGLCEDLAAEQRLCCQSWVTTNICCLLKTQWFLYWGCLFWQGEVIRSHMIKHTHYFLKSNNCVLSGLPQSAAQLSWHVQNTVHPDLVKSACWSTWLLHNQQHCLQLLGTGWHWGLEVSERQCNTATMLNMCTTVSQQLHLSWASKHFCTTF